MPVIVLSEIMEPSIAVIDSKRFTLCLGNDTMIPRLFGHREEFLKKYLEGKLRGVWGLWRFFGFLNQ